MQGASRVRVPSGARLTPTLSPNGREGGQGCRPVARCSPPPLRFCSRPLAGCGWAPLYADRAAGPADKELAAIKVAPIPERIGQRLALELRQWLNPNGEPVPSRYVLRTLLQTTRFDLGILSIGTRDPRAVRRGRDFHADRHRHRRAAVCGHDPHRRVVRHPLQLLFRCRCRGGGPRARGQGDQPRHRDPADRLPAAAGGAGRRGFRDPTEPFSIGIVLLPHRTMVRRRLGRVRGGPSRAIFATARFSSRLLNGNLTRFGGFCPVLRNTGRSAQAGGEIVEHLTILVSPEGQWVLPGTSDFFAALGDPDPDYDAVSFAVRNLGFIKFEVIRQSIVEIELHPRNAELPALLAVQQQLLSSDQRLFRIKYFDEELAFRNFVLGRGHDLAPVRAVPAALHAFGARPVPRRAAGFRTAVRGRATTTLRVIAQKWRVSFGHFDPNIITAGDAQPASAAAGDHRRKAAAEGSGVALYRLRARLDGRANTSTKWHRREGRGYSRQGLRRMGQRLLPVGRRIGPAALRPDQHVDAVSQRAGQAVASGPLREAGAALEDAVGRNFCHAVLPDRQRRRRGANRYPPGRRRRPTTRSRGN